jgi:hypothetical protein
MQRGCRLPVRCHGCHPCGGCRVVDSSVSFDVGEDVATVCLAKHCLLSSESRSGASKGKDYYQQTNTTNQMKKLVDVISNTPHCFAGCGLTPRSKSKSKTGKTVRAFKKISSERWVNSSAVFLQLFWVLLLWLPCTVCVIAMKDGSSSLLFVVFSTFPFK